MKKASTKRKGKYFVYIVRCRKGTLYTGYTKDVEKRLSLHSRGAGAKYLRGKGPLKLVYLKEFLCFKNAVKEECRIKKLKKSQKEEMLKEFLKEQNERG